MTNLPDRLMLPALSACLLQPLRSTNFTVVTTLDLFLLFTPAPRFALLEAPASDPSLHQGVDSTGTLRLDDVCCLTVAAVDKVHAEVGTGIPAHTHTRTQRVCLAALPL